MFRKPTSKFIAKIKHRVAFVEKEKGSDRISSAVLLSVYLSTQFLKKPKAVASFVEVYAYLSHVAYARLLDFYANECYDKGLDDLTDQMEFEKGKVIDDFKSRPIDFVYGFLLKAGAAAFEKYSSLEEVYDSLNKRFDYYKDSAIDQEFRIDTFLYNLDRSGQSKGIVDFETDLLAVSNLGIEKKSYGMNSIISFKEPIDLMSKKLIRAYSEFYDKMSSK